MIKANDIREQTEKELETRLDDIKKNLFNLKFQKAIGQLENTQAIRNLRKEAAVVETLIREKQLGIDRKTETGRSGNPGKKKAAGNSKKTRTKSKTG